MVRHPRGGPVRDTKETNVVNRRILSAITALVGLIVIALAVCSATVWRPSSTAEAALATTPDQHYVVTEPGVLGLVNSDVTIKATGSENEDVTLYVAHSSDVQAWLEDDPYVSVTGLSSWTQLDSTDVTTSCDAASATASVTPPASASAKASASASATSTTDAKGCTALEATDADPADFADLWLATKTGKGSVSLELDATDPDLVVLAATDGSSDAPRLSLSWPRNVSTPWLVPGLVIGGLLLLVGVFMLLMDLQARREDEQRRAAAAERAARLSSADSTSTAGIPAVGDPDRPLTRREKRDKERAEKAGEEWIDPRTGRVYLAGVEAPDVPTAPASEQVESLSDDAAEASVGAARGAAVVPGLDEETVAAHRAARELEDDAPFAVASDDEPADAPAGAPETAERTASAETTVIEPVEAPVLGAEDERTADGEEPQQVAPATDDTTETEPVDGPRTEADAEDPEAHDGEEDA